MKVWRLICYLSWFQFQQFPQEPFDTSGISLNPIARMSMSATIMIFTTHMCTGNIIWNIKVHINVIGYCNLMLKNPFKDALDLWKTSLYMKKFWYLCTLQLLLILLITLDVGYPQLLNKDRNALTSYIIKQTLFKQLAKVELIICENDQKPSLDAAAT